MPQLHFHTESHAPITDYVKNYPSPLTTHTYTLAMTHGWKVPPHLWSIFHISRQNWWHNAILYPSITIGSICDIELALDTNSLMLLCFREWKQAVSCIWLLAFNPYNILTRMASKRRFMRIGLPFFGGV